MTEIANRESGGRVERRLPVALDKPIVDLDEVWRLSQILSQTTMVPAQLRNQPGNVMILIMTGQELGLTWNQALREVYVTKGGQPGLRGEFVLMRIREAGHDYDHTDPIEDECVFRLHRNHEAPVDGFENKPCGKGRDYFGRFTMHDAEIAGLITIKDGKAISRSQSGSALPWELYGGDMLFWRAVSRACKRGCPEVTMGFSLAGTGDDGGGPDGPVVTGEVLPQPPPVVTAETAREQLREMDQQARERPATMMQPTDFADDETPDPGPMAGKTKHEAEEAFIGETGRDNVTQLHPEPHDPKAPTESSPTLTPTPSSETAGASTADTPTEETQAGSSTAQAADSPSDPPLTVEDGSAASSALLSRVGRRFRDLNYNDAQQRVFTASVAIRRWITRPSDMTAREARIVLEMIQAVIDEHGTGAVGLEMLHKRTQDLRAAWEGDEPEMFEEDE